MADKETSVVPAVSPPVVTLRKYQRDACRSMWIDMFDNAVDSGILCLPTGGGKTLTAAAFVRVAQKQGKIQNVLWLAHRSELVNQAKASFELLDPNIKIGLWISGSKNIGEDITIGMIGSSKTIWQTQKDWDLIVVDECHHDAQQQGSYSNLYQKLQSNLNYDKKLGLTATASRLDGRVLDYKKIYYQINFLDLVRDGHLSKPIYTEMLTKDFYRLDRRYGKGDFTDKSLQRLDNPGRNKKIAKQWTDNRKEYGQTLVFCVSKNNCSNMAKEFEAMNPGLVTAVITGETKDDERDSLRERMLAGEIDVVFNCAVFIEGADMPSVRSVFLARPTVSDTYFMQMAGRGARKFYDSTGKCVKDSFHLVVIMDDITKFSTLVQDWVPDLASGDRTDLNPTQTYGQRVAKRKAALERACDDLGTSTSLQDARIMDIIYVLCFSTKYQAKAGVPIDQDRADCLVRMTMYAKSCWNKEVDLSGNERWYFNIDKLVQSYTSCVFNGEFPRPMWEKICWAFYFKHILKHDKVKDFKTGKKNETWQFIELVEFTDEMRSKQQARIKQDFDTAKKLNNEYNTLYGGESLGRMVIQKLTANAEAEFKGKKPKVLASMRKVCRSITSVESKNRTLTVRTSLEIRGDRDPNIRALYRAGEIFTEHFQDFLDDSCCNVSFRATKRNNS